MDKHREIKLQKVSNGYLIQGMGSYGAIGEPIYFPSFTDALIGAASNFDEADFVSTIKETQAVSIALEGFFGKIIAPKLLAIEAKINPGIENVLDDDEDKKKDLSQ